MPDEIESMVKGLVKGMRGMGNSLKLNAILERVGQDKVEPVFDKVMKPIQRMKLETTKGRLDAFRKAVGEANFNAIASGPSLKPMMDEWLDELRGKMVAQLVTALRSLIPDDVTITDAEMVEGINYLLNH